MLKIKNSFGEFEVLVDSEDLVRIQSFNWNVRVRDGKAIYVYRNPIEGTRMLHRFILNLTDPNQIVDHIDMNPLNNTKENLRVTTKSENAVNTLKSNRSGTYTSEFKGVSYSPRSGAYRARIGDSLIGQFSTEVAAANAYNFYAKIYYQMPRLNEVPHDPDWFSKKSFKGFSKYRGVERYRDRGFRVSIWLNGRKESYGHYDSEEEAAVVFNKIAYEAGFPLTKLNVINNTIPGIPEEAWDFGRQDVEVRVLAY